MKVLIAGATGHFGGLIAEHLAAHAHRGDLIVTSRALPSAQRLAASLAAAKSPVEITSRALDAASLESCRRAVDGCALCIDGVGPFQVRDETLIRACAEAGCDYLDLSDDAGFSRRVAGVAASAAIRVFTAHSTFSATVLLVVSDLIARAGVPREVRVGLVMATRGGAGRAAMRTLLTTLDDARTFHQPGFALTFPPPIGPRQLRTFPTPNERWLREVLAVPQCVSAIGFSNRAIDPALFLLARVGLRLSSLAGLLRAGRAMMDWWPRSRMAGCLQIWARWEDRQEAMSLLARDHAPDVPCFPAILTGLRYLHGESPPTSPGIHWLHEWLPWSDWERFCRDRSVEILMS